VTRVGKFLPLDGNVFSMKKTTPQKPVFAGKNWFLPLVGKITIKSIFATTKQVRNIVLEIEILICVCLRRTKSTIQT